MAILVQFKNDMTSLYAWFNRLCSGYTLTDSLLGVVSMSGRASTCGKSRVSHTECTCEARSPSVGPNRAEMPRSSWLHADGRKSTKTFKLPQRRFAVFYDDMSLWGRASVPVLIARKLLLGGTYRMS